MRAVGRTSSGAGVAAIVVPEGRPGTAALEEELAQMEVAFGPRIHKLVFGITGRLDRPLEAELVPEGELL